MRRYISARGNVSHFPSGVEKKLVFERDVKASKLTGNTSISSVNNIMSTERFFHHILAFNSERHWFWV